MESPEKLLDELASTELTDEEVRAILVRLSAGDCGLAVKATLSAVGEVTGVPVVVLGRMIADIRGETFERRIGATVKRHEFMIRRLTERTEELGRRTGLAAYRSQAEYSEIDSRHMINIRDFAAQLSAAIEKEKLDMAKKMARTARELTVLVSAAAACLVAWLCLPEPRHIAQDSGTTITVDHDTYRRDYSGRVIIVGSDGSVREPITDEEHAHTSELMKAEASSNRR